MTNSTKDVYRVMLTDRNQYLVRTTRGSTVIARWDATARQFRRLSAMSSAPRNALIACDLVAAVSTARSPGSQGTRTRWCPFTQCQHDTTAPKQEAWTPAPWVHPIRRRMLGGTP